MVPVEGVAGAEVNHRGGNAKGLESGMFGDFQHNSVCWRKTPWLLGGGEEAREGLGMKGTP